MSPLIWYRVTVTGDADCVQFNLQHDARHLRDNQHWNTRIKFNIYPTLDIINMNP
jgi:hypothetical protein